MISGAEWATSVSYDWSMTAFLLKGGALITFTFSSKHHLKLRLHPLIFCIITKFCQPLAQLSAFLTILLQQLQLSDVQVSPRDCTHASVFSDGKTR